MSTIGYIDDQNGNHVFPVTHERAVMDSDGVTLETKLGQKQNTIQDISTIRSGAAAGATAVQPAALDAKQDVISDLHTIRSGAALGSTSVQPADIEDMVEAEPIGSIIPPVNPSEFATTEEVSQLEAKVTEIEDDIEVKDPLLFDYESSFVNITSLTDFTDAIVRKATGEIETARGKGLLYFPVVAGYKYKVSLNNLYCEGAYGIVSFSSSVPAINGTVTVIKSYDSSGSYTETVQYTASADGYILVQYGSSAQKSRISAQGEVLTPVAKFVEKDDVDDELSGISENPVQNKVLKAKFDDLQAAMYDAVTVQTEMQFTQLHGYIVRESNNTIESGNLNTGILYFPVVSGHNYKVFLNNLYCVSAYSTVSFSPNVPALNGITSLIWHPEETDSYTETVDYSATADGYVLILYNTTTQIDQISAVEVSVELVEKYERGLMWKDCKISAIGDSLTEKNYRTLKNYLDYLHEWTGITVQNLGISGTGYANGASSSKSFYNRVSQIASDTDVITIFGSFNDMAVSEELGNITDSGFNTICGFINETISAIQAAFPLVNLGIITPCPWSGYHPTATGNSVGEQYVDAIIAICKLRSIPCLDLFHCSNLRPWDASFRSVAYKRDGTYSASTEGTPNAIQVTADLLSYIRSYGGLPNAQVGDWVLKDGAGVHPDEDGHKLIAPRFKSFLGELLK